MQQPQSIYRLIRSALGEEGRLPEDFALPPDEHGQAYQYKVATGTLKSFRSYGNSYRDLYRETHSLIRLLERYWKKRSEKNETKLVAFLRGRPMHQLADSLVTQIREGKAAFAPEELGDLVSSLLTQAVDPDLVQLGLCLSVLVDAQNQRPLREAVLTLGRCQYFTLYAAWAVRDWRNSQALLLELAKTAHGAGRYLAVSQMEAADDDTRDWIIGQGCNDPRYGLICAQKGDLAGCLARDPLPQGLLRGAGSILSVMAETTQFPGMADYDRAPQAVERFLHHADGSGDLHVLESVLILRDWLADGELPEETRLHHRSRAIAARPHWEELVRQAAEEGDKDALLQAVVIAQRMDLDLSETVWTRMERAPEEIPQYTDYLMDNPRYADRVVGLYQEVLDLDRLASGMGEALLEGEEHWQEATLARLVTALSSYPGKGIPLVRAALGSPVLHCRGAALTMLESWTVEQGDPAAFDPSLPVLLQTLCDQDPVEEYRLRAEHLLQLGETEEEAW